MSDSSSEPCPGPASRPLAGAASNPCLSCGACCAYFRASFHWLETTAGDGSVPAGMTVPVTPHLVAMRGSDRRPPRCVALEGAIGTAVRCSIYERRASPCREFQASWVDGIHNERCDRARAAHGLSPLERPDIPAALPGPPSVAGAGAAAAPAARSASLG